MFTALIVKPLFNLLVLIYAILPGHNFGLALIIFTIIIRILLWPLVKKQLHQAKMMRKLQPELKRIKKETKGDRQKESVMMMELYKERGISPFGTLPTLIVQFMVLIALYSGLRKIINDPHTIVTFAYPSVRHLGWIQQLAHNINLFDNTLLGFVDLGKSALPKGGGLYIPALILVLGSGVIQFFQGKQLLPTAKDSKSLKTILKEAGDGKSADQTDVNAAVGRSTIYFLPVIIVISTLSFASALALYWLVGGLVGYIQQSIILRDDGEEMEVLAGSKSSKNVKAIPEAEVIKAATKKPSSKNNSKKKKPVSKRKK